MTRNRWFQLMNNMGLPDSLTSFDDLCVAYGEKHRYYHTSEHISAMLRHFMMPLN